MTKRSWMPLPLWGGGGDRIVGWGRVSREDWEDVRRFRWWLSDGYPCRTVYRPDGSKTTVSLHRHIMQVEPGDPIEVDHRNRDRTDATRGNLRLASRYENEGNKPRVGYSSRFVGVSFDTNRGKWKSQASFNGVYVYLGSFDTEAQAVQARARFDAANGREDRSEFLPEG